MKLWKKNDNKVDSLLVNFVLDESSSMNQIQDAVISGFNEFKASQVEQGETRFSLTLFNTSSEVVYVNEKDAVDLSPLNYKPNGMTALIDATGDAIEALELSLEKMAKKDRPTKILFVTYTDGGENASKRWNSSQIAELIQKKRNDGWEFVFLGADQDAWGQAQKHGLAFAQANTISSDATLAGVSSTFSSLTRATSSYRTKGSASTTDSYFNSDEIDTRSTLKKPEDS